MSEKKRKFLLPILVLLVGVVAAVLIISSRKSPPRVERPQLGPLVEVVQAELETVPITVMGHGEVVAKIAVDVVPQVAGRVVKVHPSLVAGGFFRAGDVLMVIDPRDYELAVERAQAAVARAQVTLEREQAEAEVAREEWDVLHPGEEPTSGLVVREPQVKQAEAELAAAIAELSAAELNLQRTRISLPFDGVVVSESVDVGQFVGTGSRLAQVYGTDVVEVRVPLSSRELAWFAVPTNGEEGARVEVSTDFGGTRQTWEGRVTRMEAQVDQQSRMVHVVVEIADPYATTDGRPALLPGTFVDVSIAGRTFEGVVPIPRHAVREGGGVWVVEDGTLRVREIEVLRADRRQTLVSSGLGHGDLVIVSALDAVTDGMKVRVANGDSLGTTAAAGGAEGGAS